MRTRAWLVAGSQRGSLRMRMDLADLNCVQTTTRCPGSRRSMPIASWKARTHSPTASSPSSSTARKWNVRPTVSTLNCVSMSVPPKVGSRTALHPAGDRSTTPSVVAAPGSVLYANARRTRLTSTQRRFHDSPPSPTFHSQPARCSGAGSASPPPSMSAASAPAASTSDAFSADFPPPPPVKVNRACQNGGRARARRGGAGARATR